MKLILLLLLAFATVQCTIIVPQPTIEYDEIYCDESPDDYGCIERPESETMWLRRQLECAITRCYNR